MQTSIIGEGQYIRADGHGYGHVILQLEPNPNTDGCFMLWSVTQNHIPNFNREYLITESYLKAVYQGLCEALVEEVEDYRYTQYVPFPYQNTNVRITGGSYHPIDSRASSFQIAAYIALARAVSQLPDSPLYLQEIPCLQPRRKPQPKVLMAELNNIPQKYRNLHEFLQAGYWKNADSETRKLVFELAGGEYSIRDDDYWLPLKGILNIAEADVQIIDRLWITYSQGRFGFSVQKQIFLECGGKLGLRDEKEVWEKFGDRVGWRLDKNRWVWLEDVQFNLCARVGHLPCLEWWGLGTKEEVMQLILTKEFKSDL
ncbi:MULTISPECIES: GUN4 domain-containing protein [Nostocales]|uniref:GUN4-like domain-containing protein n=3 Tax=Nostocales TaxID=1161 RepID=A0A8S9TEI2_9CYAN|nr:GUN4 domain-containing protein [Tolypothrix bouteillei]KAF3890558.1 hypothetical protein DA73_0400037725 [Tolypothrix bouteillei VB521301]